MRFGKLNETLQTHNSSFVKKLINENLDEVDTIKEIKDRLKELMNEADNYAKENHLKHKYLELAQEPLWVNVKVEPEHFIFKGFDAYVAMDLTENIDNIKPYVIIHNNNVKTLENGQVIAIADEFISDLNDFQRTIFEEALSVVENRSVETLKKVWNYEKERINKWIRISEISIEGIK